MSVARGHEALTAPLTTVEPGAGRHPVPPSPALRLQPVRALPVRPLATEPVGVAAWSHAVRLRALPATLLGPAVAALLVLRAPGARLGVLGVAVALLATGHAVAALVRDLGDARPDRAGVLPRRHAGRALLGLLGLAVVLVGGLTAVRGAVVPVEALLGVVVVLLGVSRRSGTALAALAGAGVGAGTFLVAVSAALGAVPLGALAPALVVGALVAAVLVPARAAVPDAVVRAVTVLPYAVAGLAVATSALPWPVLLVALALPAARRTADTADAAALPVHARLVALLLLAGCGLGLLAGAPPWTG